MRIGACLEPDPGPHPISTCRAWAQAKGIWSFGNDLGPHPTSTCRAWAQAPVPIDFGHLATILDVCFPSVWRWWNVFANKIDYLLALLRCLDYSWLTMNIALLGEVGISQFGEVELKFYVVGLRSYMAWIVVILTDTFTNSVWRYVAFLWLVLS